MSTTTSWLKGCAFGCGGILLLGVLVVVGMTMSVVGPFQQAIDDRSTLADTFGPQDAFTPAADGSVPPDRIETFLGIREELAAICAEIDRTTSAMRELDDIDSGDAEPGHSEVMSLVVRATRGAMGMPRLMGEFFRVRNRALLDGGMGFGEYTYIYLTAYREQMLNIDPHDTIMDGPPMNGRIHDAAVDMLNRQLEALRSAGGDDEFLHALKTEVTMLAADRQRIPWRDGQPASLESSFLLFRERLDVAYCSPLSELELQRNRRAGLAMIGE